MAPGEPSGVSTPPVADPSPVQSVANQFVATLPQSDGPVASSAVPWYPPVLPQVGVDVRWPVERIRGSFAFRIYTDFPWGRRIRREQMDWDFSRTVRVLEVRAALMHAQQDTYVAVRFMPLPGYSVWSNLSKNEVQWMEHEFP